MRSVALLVALLAHPLQAAPVHAQPEAELPPLAPPAPERDEPPTRYDALHVEAPDDVPAPLAPPALAPPEPAQNTEAPAPLGVPALGVPARDAEPAAVDATDVPAPPAPAAPSEPRPADSPADSPAGVRVVLAGVLSAGGWGGGIVLRADVGLFPIAGSSALSLGLDVGASAQWSPYGPGGVFRAITPVALSLAWRVQVATHVELGARGGASVALPYDLLLATSDFQLGLAVRGLAGALVAFRLAHDVQLLAALDVHLGTAESGAGEVVALAIGARL